MDTHISLCPMPPTPSFQATARSEPWPADTGTFTDWSRRRVRPRQPRSSRAHIWAPLFFSMIVGSTSCVRGTEAASRISTGPPRQAHEVRASGPVSSSALTSGVRLSSGSAASTSLPRICRGRLNVANKSSSSVEPGLLWKGANPWTVALAQSGSMWSTTGRCPVRLVLTLGASGLLSSGNVDSRVKRQPRRSCVSPSSATP